MVRKYRVSRPILVTLLAAAVAAGMSGLAGPAVASPAGSPYMLGPEVKVSTASTLTGCSAGASADFGGAYDNTEVEPQVAVNPTNADGDRRRVPAGPLARRRRPRADLVAVDQRRDELGEAGRRAVERLPGRPDAVRPGDRPVGLLRQGRQPVLHRPADRLGRARASRLIAVTTWNGTTWGAPQMLIEDVGSSRRLQRQGLDHRRSDAGRATRTPPGSAATTRPASGRARSPTSTRSPTAASR